MQDFLANYNETTAKAYKEDLTDFSRWFEGCNSWPPVPELITSIDLREYQSHMLTVRGLKPATINRRMSAIKSWLRWANSTGCIQEIPRFPRGVAEPKMAPKALTKKEDARLLRLIERASNPRDTALVALMRFAGLRVGEAIRTRVVDIEISDRKGRVVVRSGKGTKRRTVPLGMEARHRIRPWMSSAVNEWLFPGRNKRHLSARAAQDMISKYAYLARIENITPHVLRHTFATRLIRSGVDIVVVATLLGHSRLDTTARYTQPTYSDLERAVENRLDRRD